METELDIKVRTACHRIEELYYETEGKCYVSFSGGKDSTVLLALIKLCEEVLTIPPNSIPAVFSNTGIELGVTVDFVKWVKDSGWYKNVQIIRPDVSFDWVVKNKGKPALSKMRAEMIHRWHYQQRTERLVSTLITGYTLEGKKSNRTKLADRNMHFIHKDFNINIANKCCTYLKKKPFEKYSKENGIKGVLTGIRVSEGGAREETAQKRVKNGGKLCTFTKKSGEVYKMPIIDWTDDDLENFITEYKVPLSEAYTQFGFKRTGCMACPFSPRVGEDLEYLFYHEPNRYKAAMHWMKDVYIAQNVVLPFDEAYEREREREWRLRYEPMRQEMLRKYRPHSRLIKEGQQLSLFEEE